MKRHLCIVLFAYLLGPGSSILAEDLDAIRECGNLHQLEFRNIPNAVAQYSNSNCQLKCAIGVQTLSNNSLNEGFPCPANSNGVSLVEHDGVEFFAMHCLWRMLTVLFKTNIKSRFVAMAAVW